jgi:glycosyltransferase involved in cell wall biosynthesis
MPRVTAIIIVYNGEAFLEEAIASVRAQTMAGWELLIVDDGSSDGSRDIAEAAARSDPGRIRALRHEDGLNHGMSATRNRGLSEARGDYIGFLDADDVWLPEKLAEQTALLDAHPTAGMVYGRTLIWHGWEEEPSRPDFFYELGVAADRLHPPPLLFRLLLRNVYQTPTTCNALLRREAVEAVGGFESAFGAMFEDQVFFAKMMLAWPTFVSGRCWAKYRQHEASSSAISAAAGGDREAHLRYLGWMGDYLARRHPRDLLSRYALARAQRAVRRQRRRA